MAPDYCSYKLVLGRTATLPIQFNSVDAIDPMYNFDNYAKESKFRPELAQKRARLMLDNNKIKQKTRKNAIVESLDYQIPVTQPNGDMQAAKRD